MEKLGKFGQQRQTWQTTATAFSTAYTVTDLNAVNSSCY